MNKYDKKPNPGDLIEIFRVGYQHWAIYVGDGYVIHLAPPSENAHGGASSVCSVVSDRGIVKKEILDDVVGNDKYIINNLLDEKYEPRPIKNILDEALSLVGQTRPYSLATRNCEHFVTELRYGMPESRQVRDAVAAAGAAVGLFAALGATVYFISKLFGSKEKKETQ